MSTSTVVTVVVPSYRRPELLRRCLASLAEQERRANEVVVVYRDDDEPTRELVRAHDDVRAVAVEAPGVLAAMNAGGTTSHGNVIAFIDDDAVAHHHWLAGIIGHLADPTVGGVGGRDIVHPPDEGEQLTDGPIGQITAWGKLISGHHLGTGPPREAMVLKGVNMAYRREALALPRDLKGGGAQVHWEVATGLWARRQGWRLIYDPGILVDHYPGPRFDADRRERPDPTATRDAAYNLVACLLSLQPDLALRRASFGLLVGDAMTPGLGRAVYAALRRNWPLVHRLAPSLAGQLDALRDHRRGQLVEMVPAPPVAS